MCTLLGMLKTFCQNCRLIRKCSPISCINCAHGKHWQSFKKYSPPSSFRNFPVHSCSSFLSSAFRGKADSRSGLFFPVTRRDSLRRHFRIFSWCPLSSTWGTALPRHTSGLVYWGYSSSPEKWLSSVKHASSYSTPGSIRLTASARIMAGSSPPVST